MALKGMTKIELTNVKTGEVETVEKHNMVTNALKSVLSNPFGWQTMSATEYSLSQYLNPICSNLINGIMLYESTIPEEPSQLYAQPGNVLVGYANGEVNATTDTMRGSINKNESGPLESGDGYRFVFDFNTAQGNGTIGAVGLTSYWGGRVGPDVPYEVSKSNSGWTPTPTIFGMTSVNDNLVLTNAVVYDEEKCMVTSMYLISAGTISVNRVILPARYWSLSHGISPFENYKIIETKTISTEVFGKNMYVYNGENYGYYNFCDGGDGYIWGFEHLNGQKGNSSGTAHINWIKINTDTLEFEEGTWDIDAQIFIFGEFWNGVKNYTYPSYNAKAPCSVILGGYLYCFQYDLKKVLKIEINNITNIKFIDIAIEINGKKRDIVKMCAYGNVVHISGGYLNGDTFVKCREYAGFEFNSSNGKYEYPTTNCNSMQFEPGRPICFGVYALRYTTYSQFYSYIFTVVANYLATINNLPAPVEKTADKTMKITYIIREETET